MKCTWTDVAKIATSILIVLFGIACGVMMILTASFVMEFFLEDSLINSAQEHPSEYTAITLYGNTVELEPIFADSSGQQYVIPWLDYVSPDEVILIKTIGDEITEVYIQQEIPTYE